LRTPEKNKNKTKNGIFLALEEVIPVRELGQEERTLSESVLMTIPEDSSSFFFSEVRKF
jgi:hypothetical protein